MTGYVPGPSQPLETGLYRLSDFRQVLDSPDLGAAGGANYLVVAAASSMGLVALANGDTNAYREWSEYISGTTTSDGNDQADRHRIALWLHGAAQGSDYAIEMLDARVGAKNQNLRDLVLHCADQDILPIGYIDRYAQGSDQKARAWDQYFERRRMLLGSRGLSVWEDSLIQPSVRAYIGAYVDGEFSAEVVIDQGARALGLATALDQKLRVWNRFLHELNIVLHTKAVEVLSPEHMARAIDFVHAINIDPIVPEDVKMQINKFIQKELDKLGLEQGQDVARFNVVRAISQEASLADVLGLISKFTGPSSGSQDTATESSSPTFMPQIGVVVLPGNPDKNVSYEDPYGSTNKPHTDQLLNVAAEAYVSLGMYMPAIGVIQLIRNTSYWSDAVDDYARLGGDMYLLTQRLEEVRQMRVDLMDIADEIKFPYDESTGPAMSSSTRVRIARFLSAERSGDYISAGQLLADAAPDYVLSDAGGSTSHFLDFLDRVLPKHPRKEHLSLVLENYTRHASCLERGWILNRLVAYGGGPEVSASYGHYTRSFFDSDKASYLLYYAHAALASLGIRSQDVI